jgi:hypothetical protein
MDNEYLNLTALQDMALGDNAYQCEIIQDILNEGKVAFTDILKVQEQQDASGVSALVYKFKGCIAYVSSDAALEKHQKIEGLGRLKNEVPSKQEIQELQDVYLIIKKVLESYHKEIS